jgi:predicted DNA-binding transcriptional regulator YafY
MLDSRRIKVRPPGSPLSSSKGCLIRSQTETFSKGYFIAFELLIDKTIKSDVEEWLGVDKVDVLANGEIKVNTQLPCDDMLVSKILSFGNKIKVIKPTHLKNLVLDMANQVINSYN